MKGTTRVLPVLAVHALLLASHTCFGTEQQQHQRRPWLQENFPQQPDDPGCRRSTDPNSQNDNDNGVIHRLCDPDHVLPSLHFQHLANALRVPRYTTQQDSCFATADVTNNNNNNNNEANVEEGTSPADQNENRGLEIQMGVALVQKMDLHPFRTTADNSNDGIEERAAETFGRYIHDTWGVGLDTDACGGAGVLLFLSIEDRAIYISRGSALEAYLTDRRLDSVLDTMKGYLRNEEYDTAILVALQDIMAWIDHGPPGFWEHAMHVFSTILLPVAWLVAIVGVVVRTIWKDMRQRRDYARVSSQLNEIDRARAEALQGQYCATSCPICLEEWEMEDDHEITNANGQQRRVAKVGSDGQPIKLLRCGHCMDESCWAEWVNSGRGTITKCPICQQDVGTEPTAATDQNRTNTNNTNNLRLDRNDDNDNNIANEDRILRQYRRERNFRLARLGYRYPQIIRPNQLQRWTQPTYDGSLVRDPSFVQSNPAVARPVGSSSRGSSRMGGGGFGGSSSGGGRSGRW